jgi:hypothetical protein
MTTTRYTELSQPLQNRTIHTEAEKILATIRKVQAARDLALELTLAWINCYALYRTCRDHAAKHPSPASEHAERLAMQELLKLERSCATAELILHLAESAHRRLIGGLS